MTDDLTYDEIIATIEKAIESSKSGQEPRTFSTVQYADSRNIGLRKARRELKQMLDKGVIESYRFFKENVHGVRQRVYGWRYIGGSNDN